MHSSADAPQRILPHEPRADEEPGALKHALDIEAIRVPLERELFARLEPLPIVAELRASLKLDSAVVRRSLMASSVRLTEGMAPELLRCAREVSSIFSIQKPLEIYQRDGAENAAMHMVEEPVLCEVRGRLITLLDPGSTRALLGHELGHYLAHGPSSPAGIAGVIGALLATAEDVPAPLARLGSKLSMARELTADRLGLLGCQSLDAALRLEMICTTGLPGSALTWDTEAYLAQCKELIEGYLKDGKSASGGTHPEHSLRAYASWLFSESDLYRELTGRGPGSRKIDEVNEQLRRCLGNEEGGEDAPLLQAPPIELFECALAACVMVAAADGEIVEQEVEAIERVFAPLVANVASYFDLAEAQRRFAAVAPVVASMGPGTHRALFSLLVHVVAADGVIDDQELVLVAQIGRAIGAEELFRKLLAAVVARLGWRPTPSVSVSVSVVEVPIPPRHEEGVEALRAYLGGVVRRGRGEVSLRRLLRLIGLHRRTREGILTLAHGLAEHQVYCSHDLGSIEDLDALIVLSASAPPQTTSPPKTSTDPVTQRITRAVSKLRDKLVSGDGRSPSVRLYEARGRNAFDLQGLEALSVGRSERVLTSIRSGSRATLLDASEAGRLTGARQAASELVALSREHRSRFEETGRNELAVGYPFLTGQAAGYLLRGPLVLFPVRLDGKEMGARSFAISPVEGASALINWPLLRILFTRRGLALPDALIAELDALVEDAQQAPEAVLARLEQVGVMATRLSGSLRALEDPRPRASSWPRDHLEVEECAILGLFPLSSSDLLQDYDVLLAELGQDSNPASRLGSAAALLPAGIREALPEQAQESPAPKRCPIPILTADATQREVLRKARTARALVVDGPPGAGKSQVIVNLVADAVARGERVAVVSEKRAALDVVAQRLDAVGLSPAMALVHDVQEDRKPLYTRLASRLENLPSSVLDPAPLEQREQDLRVALKPLESRKNWLATRSQSGASVGELLVLSSLVDAPSLGIPSLARLPTTSLRSTLVAFSKMATHASIFAGDSPLRREGRPSFSGPGQLEAAILALSKAIQCAQELTGALQAAGAGLDALLAVKSGLEAARASQEQRKTQEEQLLFIRMLGALERGDALDALQKAEQLASEHATALAKLSRRPPATLELAVVGQLAAFLGWLGRWWRFFSPSFWKARAAVRAAATRLWPERAGAAVNEALARETLTTAQAGLALAALDEVLGQLDVRHLSPTTPDAVRPLLARLADLRRQLAPLVSGRSGLQALGLWPETSGPEALHPWDTRVTRALDALDRHEQLARLMEPCRRQFPWLKEREELDGLRGLKDWLEREGRRAAAADAQLAVVRGLYEDAEPLLFQAVDVLPPGDVDLWRRALLRGWAETSLRQTQEEPRSEEPSVTLPFADLPAQEQRLKMAFEEAQEEERRQLLARLNEAELLRAPVPERGRRRTAVQATRESMVHECKKQRNVMPLRGFVRQFAPSGLLDVMPIWLLSPETMAVLFPKNPLFDLVIFDEASQCTVESGFPALLRARRFVVVGDEKQMPPSSFFRTSGAEVEEAAEQEDAEDSEVFDGESLLTLARTRVPALPLRWHYRCTSEELIAFSNHAMYGGSLLTIPTPRSRASTAAIRWVSVADGTLENGENRPEARRVVEELSLLLQGTEGRRPPSVGVITMNVQQRKAVLDEIDRRKESDASFADRWNQAMAAERLDERPFVKNLENVQGDERDVILFSTGYAPVERKSKKGSEWVVPARFGPLGQRGGERRLNVAISRAKNALVLVSSFVPAQLSVARTLNAGPKLFKQFLEFAHQQAAGQRLQAERTLALARSASPHEPPVVEEALPDYVPLNVQFAMVLQARGFACDLDVGASSLRIPLAVVDPRNPANYALGVIFDEGQTSFEALDQHVHWPGILQTRGWQLLSVSALDWHHERTAVIEAVLSRLPGAPVEQRAS